MKLFVSYTLRDKEITKEKLVILAQRLKFVGKVFVDIIDNDSIDKQLRVVSELNESDVLIVIKSSNILKSKWVEFEIEKAKERKIPILEVPLKVLENSEEVDKHIIQNLCNIIPIIQ